MVLKMTELTDLEICKKIAEIDGVEYEEFKTYDGTDVKYIAVGNGIFEPTADKRHCFDLMIKYDIKFHCEMNGEYYAYSRKTGGSSYNKNPVKAILLAIIGADDD